MQRRQLFAAVATLAIAAVTTGAQTPSFDVPTDLAPLLAPPPSELRVVARWYSLDRELLERNYAGSPARLTMTSADLPNGVVPVSGARLSRLKRFDLNWSNALSALSSETLTTAGRQDLLTLQNTVAHNLRTIEDDGQRFVRIDAATPYLRPLVALTESRIRIAPLDIQQAATTLDALARTIGPTQSPAPAAELVTAITLVSRDLAEWFNFYNGYDPLFTWWMPGPYEAVQKALAAEASRLSTLRGITPPPSSSVVIPAEQGRFSDVPDLKALVALPRDGHDELVTIMARFRAGHDSGNAPQAFYTRWLAALTSLNFATLSRDGQISYLYIAQMSRYRVARSATPLPTTNPRKTDNSGIPGPARGREGLRRDLEDELIPYSADELLQLAEREFAWVEREMVAASRQLGFGDDWKRAIEHVKGMHPPPGDQPLAVRALIDEAVDYLRARDLITVPTVGAESMHMVMLTPAEQLINPFFRGGPRISVSYPTTSMTTAQRVQSMRGNNTPFSHATAHHEMIPGHFLDDYTRARYAGVRAEVAPHTPFFREGWALYWELRLYEMGFHDTPEERVGALFWLMHRCARIVFSLQFHMGHWSPQEAINFLVERVGHERENATAEVRRSFEGTYTPLYQAAYLLGGLQIRALQRELVAGGRLTDKAFHDAVIRLNTMPIALMRLRLNGLPLSPASSLTWRFYDSQTGR